MAQVTPRSQRAVIKSLRFHSSIKHRPCHCRDVRSVAACLPMTWSLTADSNAACSSLNTERRGAGAPRCKARNSAMKAFQSFGPASLRFAHGLKVLSKHECDVDPKPPFAPAKGPAQWMLPLGHKLPFGRESGRLF